MRAARVNPSNPRCNLPLFKTRAISALIFEYGTTLRLLRTHAVATRVRKSAIGSVTVLIQNSGGLRGGRPCPVAERHAHFANSD